MPGRRSLFLAVAGGVTILLKALGSRLSLWLLAAALHLIGAIPVAGSFGGAGASLTMVFDLRIGTAGG
ncbi:MAG: hypothetical protein H6970_14020 [Gammaproteobacteria bacterium]|nr:hypothetical protein [Gammaproteobacteria bacterium]